MNIYKAFPKEVRVYLDGKVVGNIRPFDGGFSYFPKLGCEIHGDVLATIQDVKDVLDKGVFTG